MPLTKCKAESLDLTANYTFTGDVTLASGGTLNLISTQTASGVSSIEFTTGIDSTYDEYWFIFNNMHPSSEGTNYVEFQTSTNGGSSYGVTMTSTFFIAYQSESGAFTALSYGTGEDLAQSTNFQQINRFGTGADNDQSFSGILKLYNPSSTTYVKHFVLQTSNNNENDFAVSSLCAGYFNTTSAINGIKFAQKFNNIDDGTIQMFGVSQ
jgi:hypothetical protein